MEDEAAGAISLPDTNSRFRTETVVTKLGDADPESATRPFSIVLVPTDFSPHSHHALEYAVTIASAFESSLHLLLAFERPVRPASEGEILIPNDFWGTDRAGARARLEALLAPAKARRIRTTTHLVDDDPDEAIVELATTLPAQLIVMGTRGRSGLAHVFFGSVAERTVRRAPCPVMTVRAPAEDEAFERIPLERR